MGAQAPGRASMGANVSPVDDAILVAHAQHDRRAFEPLYHRYFEAIFRFCYLRLRDWQEAEDATSDIFANAIANLHRFRADQQAEGFRCWLFTIARNQIANRRRDHARHPNTPLSDAEVLPDGHSSPEEIAVAADAHRLLADLLARLKLDQRDLLELRLVGLNDAEIARMLGRSHDAVRKEQSRTIRALRELVRANPELGAFHDR